ncbi:hypothetical protein HanPSC8_Chr10g0424411 [Helianthus annuus]|nr:hypothetical protein HanPSC8_Chr10g0424411 [Helianthus annuus]
MLLSLSRRCLAPPYATTNRWWPLNRGNRGVVCGVYKVWVVCGSSEKKENTEGGGCY